MRIKFGITVDTIEPSREFRDATINEAQFVLASLVSEAASIPEGWNASTVLRGERARGEWEVRVSVRPHK